MQEPKKVIKLKLENISLRNIISSKWTVQTVVLLGVFLVIVLLGYYFDIKSSLADLAVKQQQAVSIQRQYVMRQRKLIQLKNYKAKMAQFKQQFDPLLQQLPTEAQMVKLLKTISDLGRANGVVFKMFDPLAEKKLEFYSILPIQVRVFGNYHQIASFINQLANLNRLITYNKIFLDVKDASDEELNITTKSPELELIMLLKAYHRNVPNNKKLANPTPSSSKTGAKRTSTRSSK